MKGLPDHAHEPTLKRISKDTLIIASPAGAAVAEGLGFRNVRTLDHGQKTTIGDGKLQINATVGGKASPARAYPHVFLWRTCCNVTVCLVCVRCLEDQAVKLQVHTMDQHHLLTKGWAMTSATLYVNRP